MSHRTPLVALIALTLAAGGGNGSTPTTPTTPTPTTPAVVTLSGTVRSNSGVGIAGASLRITDGANAGRSTATTASGAYSTTGLTPLGTGCGLTVYDGTLLTGGGGVTQITNSSGVSWSFSEVKQ